MRTKKFKNICIVLSLISLTGLYCTAAAFDSGSITYAQTLWITALFSIVGSISAKFSASPDE